jgi:hypothetical protein
MRRRRRAARPAGRESSRPPHAACKARWDSCCVERRAPHHLPRPSSRPCPRHQVAWGIKGPPSHRARHSPHCTGAAPAVAAPRLPPQHAHTCCLATSASSAAEHASLQDVAHAGFRSGPVERLHSRLLPERSWRGARGCGASPQPGGAGASGPRKQASGGRRGPGALGRGRLPRARTRRCGRRAAPCRRAPCLGTRGSPWFRPLRRRRCRP